MSGVRRPAGEVIQLYNEEFLDGPWTGLTPAYTWRPDDVITEQTGLDAGLPNLDPLKYGIINVNEISLSLIFWTKNK